MKVTQVVEHEDGNRTVNLDLSDSQTRFIVEVGIGVLLAAGAAHFIPKPSEETDGVLEIVTDEGVIH